MDKTEIELFEKWYADFDGSADYQENLAKDSNGHYLLTDTSLLYAGWIASSRCNRWRSINYSTPIIGATVLVHTSVGNIFSDLYIHGGIYENYFAKADNIKEKVTHWLWLPMPPEEE